MSYEKRFSIMDGIEVPNLRKNEFEELFDDYINHYPDSEIIKRCKSYFLMKDNQKITSDDLYDFLNDDGILLNDEFLDSVYIGNRIFEIGEDSPSCARIITTLSVFPTIPNYIFDFIQKCFPEYHINRYLINWVL